MRATRHRTSAVLISAGVLLFGSTVFFRCTALTKRCHPQNAAMLQETIFFKLTARAPSLLHATSSWSSLVSWAKHHVFCLPVCAHGSSALSLRSQQLPCQIFPTPILNARCPTWKFFFTAPPSVRSILFHHTLGQFWLLPKGCLKDLMFLYMSSC